MYVEPKSPSFLMLAICAACNGQTRHETAGQRISRTESPSASAPISSSQAGVVQLKPFIVYDPQLGIEAFRFLMPAE